MSLNFQGKTPIVLYCGHTYHKRCLKSWCSSESTGNTLDDCLCPMCRSEFSFNEGLIYTKPGLEQIIEQVNDSQINDIEFDENLYDEDAIEEIKQNIQNMKNTINERGVHYSISPSSSGSRSPRSRSRSRPRTPDMPPPPPLRGGGRTRVRRTRSRKTRRSIRTRRR